jgi:hypothetical protein
MSVAYVKIAYPADVTGALVGPIVGASVGTFADFVGA